MFHEIPELFGYFIPNFVFVLRFFDPKLGFYGNASEPKPPNESITLFIES